MEKNIKYYLHLYLGCKAFYYNKGFSYEPKEVTIYGYDLSKENNCVVHTGGLNDKPSWFKPILRPLSDMTHEERLSYYRLFKADIPLAILNAEETIYLLSKHFDLFGLIEAGLAIDKTTLKP